MALPVWTVLLAGGHVLPSVLLVVALAAAGPLWPAALALLCRLRHAGGGDGRARESLWRSRCIR